MKQWLILFFILLTSCSIQNKYVETLGLSDCKIYPEPSFTWPFDYKDGQVIISCEIWK
jgi:hypothetical protein